MSDFNFPVIPSFQMPEIPEINIDTPAQHMWADEQFQILKKYIQAFENSLDPEHEVGIMMTNFGQSVLMYVTQVSYEDPVLMVFKGFVNGREATLIQHINQPLYQNQPYTADTNAQCIGTQQHHAAYLFLLVGLAGSGTVAED